MSLRARTIILAAIAAMALLIAFPAEAWTGVPIIAAVAIYLLARDRHLGRATTAAALGVVGSLAFVAIGVIVVLLAGVAKAMAGFALASGSTAILVGVVILALSLRHLRRATRTAPSSGARVSSP